MSAGSLYIARSADYPGILKVGFTTGRASARVKRLSGAGSLSRWELVITRPVSDARQAERLCHARLEQAQARIEPRREFFRIDEASARHILEEVASHFRTTTRVSAPTPSLEPRCQFPAAWRPILLLRRQYANHTVTLSQLFEEHAVTGSRAAEARLVALGLACVNRRRGAFTYRVDAARAAGLLEELVLSAEADAANLLKSDEMLTTKVALAPSAELWVEKCDGRP